MQNLKEINAKEWDRRNPNRSKLYKMKHRYKIAHERICAFNPEKWIDVGAGNGYLAEIIKETLPKVHVTGIDFVDIALNEAKALDDSKIVNLDNENVPYKDESFNYVSCLEVLEHLVLREHALEELYRILTPGGRCLVSVPNLQFIEYLLALTRGKMPHPAADPRHMSIFTLRFLQEQMKKAGFKVLFTAGCDASPPFLAKVSKHYLCKTIMVEGEK